MVSTSSTSAIAGILLILHMQHTEVGGATPPLHWKRSGLVLTLMSCWVDLGSMEEEEHTMLKSRQVPATRLSTVLVVSCLPVGICLGCWRR